MMEREFKFDVVLAGAVLFLLVFGLIMITSIGVPKSISLSAEGVLYPNCGDEGVDCYLLFKKHLFRLAAGVLAFIVAFRIPMSLWGKFSKLLFPAVVALLFFVVFYGHSYDTIATNWIKLFDTSIQPSEIAKPVLIVYLAYWFSKKGASVESFYDGFIPFVVISGFILVPLILQNDFGAILTLGMICATIYFAAGARKKHLALGVLVAMVFAGIVIASVDHVRDRFSGYLRADQECLEDYCWQSQQANIAVGSGGIWGRGLTQGVQKSYWLPQASDDFIFAASAEELGFLRIIFIVGAYFLISYRGYKIAGNAKNQFERYAAIGITTWIVGQAYVNIAVNTALLPVTGITLPFVSYGGTSLVACLFGIGLLLNISNNASYAHSVYRRGDRRPYHSQSGRYRRA